MVDIIVVGDYVTFGEPLAPPTDSLREEHWDLRLCAERLILPINVAGSPIEGSSSRSREDYRLGSDKVSRRHFERHRMERIGWLRAAVLGANDGIVSTASLVLGVAAAQATRQDILIAGVAGLVAGAMSMAAGEYVSVSSQADTEQADIAREQAELTADVEHERAELANIYVSRGLQPRLAAEVADQLMAHSALEAHVRDELGISEALSARPIQAALSSATTFALGAVLPLLTVILSPGTFILPFVAGISLLSLALLGGLAAQVGGASAVTGATRVAFWGALAMGMTSAVGALFGAAV